MLLVEWVGDYCVGVFFIYVFDVIGFIGSMGRVIYWVFYCDIYVGKWWVVVFVWWGISKRF